MTKHRSRPRKKVLVAGSSGLIGTQLVAFLDTGGHDVYRLVRRKAENENEIEWYPDKGVINPGDIDGFDAVIHLGGEGIGDKRWSKREERKSSPPEQAVRPSLQRPSHSLRSPQRCSWLRAQLATMATARRGLTEESELGEGYLSDVCSAWEKSAQPAVDAGIRTIWLRTGIVLSGIGGALGKMLLASR